MIKFLMNWIESNVAICELMMQVDAINLLKLSVYKKLNSSYGENTALYIHRLMTKQVID